MPIFQDLTFLFDKSNECTWLCWYCQILFRLFKSNSMLRCTAPYQSEQKRGVNWVWLTASAGFFSCLLIFQSTFLDGWRNKFYFILTYWCIAVLVFICLSFMSVIFYNFVSHVSLKTLLNTVTSVRFLL